eukprot:5807593-Pleurochrysis_carterae.AAC.3
MKLGPISPYPNNVQLQYKVREYLPRPDRDGGLRCLAGRAALGFALGAGTCLQALHCAAMALACAYLQSRGVSMTML